MSRTGQAKALEKMTFEESFEELESLVEKFEEGQLPLSEWIERLERAMKLYRKCADQLADAEKKVSEILEKINPVESGDPSQENAL